MAYEDEEGMPSVRRKKEVELSRGVVILPPERMKKDERDAELEKIDLPLPSRQKSEEQRPGPKAPSLPSAAGAGGGALPLVAIGIAVIAVLFSLFAMSSIGSMKTELKAIATDLRAYQETTLTVKADFDAPHSLESFVPLKEVLPSFSVPITPQEIEGNGIFSVILPGYNIPAIIPWNGTVTVFGTITINTTQLSEDRTVKLSYSLPGVGQTSINIKGSDLMGERIESVIKRIEKLSK